VCREFPSLGFGRHNPEDAVPDGAVILARATLTTILWKQVAHLSEPVFRQLVATNLSHPGLLAKEAGKLPTPDSSDNA
jgi:hypothetical protein